jgi:uncharacterized SAM-binding protein YcdF (DUF218 family)
MQILNLTLRGALLVLGAFLLINAVGDVFAPRFDQSAWITDLRALPAILRGLLLFAGGAALLALAVVKVPSPALTRALFAAVCVLMELACWQTVQFYRLWHYGVFRPGVPVPFTFFVATGLCGIAWLLRTHRWNVADWRWMPFAGGVLAALVLLPLCQIFFFGKSDYRRNADAIVVLGARAYDDGRLSDALADRMRTAIELFHEGRAPRLILSGGPVNDHFSETEAMRDFALDRGVPIEAMELDPDGWNTDLTARNTARICSEKKYARVLAVSHFYHLPRIRMTMQRAGVTAYTVPAKERAALRKTPYLILREIGALWAYYLRPLTGI